jgi:uncharacterized protein (DUF885 family)
MGRGGAQGGGSEAATELDRLERATLDHVFALQPGYAVFLGLHEYDGRLPELSRPATDRWVERARELRRGLDQIPVDDLADGRRLDRSLLGLLLESALFDLEDARDCDRNPMSFVGPISLTAYMVREYAPLPRRVDAMVSTLNAAPGLLEEGRRRLEPHMPEPFLQLSLSMAAGLPSHFAEAEALARAHDPSLGDRVHAARAGAEKAIAEFVDRVRGDYLPEANQEFPLGPDRFQRLLWVREGTRTPYEEILAAGRADLKRNQARLAEIAHARQQSIAALHEAMFTDHPEARRLLDEARGFVQEARRFVTSTGTVTLPEPDACRVEETPSYGRALSTASMNPPGPYDTTGDEGIYFITPVDPSWTSERQEEWLRMFNRAMLRNITVHEVYPGHYLQFLHLRRAANTAARRTYLSAAFTEGWAHYCEQLAIELGLANGSAEAEVAQLDDALLRDCRLIVSIGLHTQGMTLKEATAVFQKEAHMEALPAEREAIRGTFNPEYFCYTLGKLAILEARRKYLDSRFRGSLRAFHDRLLSFGCPPVGMLDPLVAAS